MRGKLILAAIVFLVVSCGAPSTEPRQDGRGPEGGATQEPAAEGKQVAEGEAADLAMTINNLQTVGFNQFVEGAQDAAKDAGASLTVHNANNYLSAQNTAIENFVQQKADAVIVLSIDVEGVKPAIQQAAEAGLVVIAADAIVESPDVDVQVGVDNYGAGSQMGDFFDQWASEEGIDSAQVGVVGALNSSIQIQRQDGFTETIEAKGHNVVQVVDGQNVPEIAQGAAEDLLTANPDMDAVYATGEPALTAAIAAARSQGMTDRITLVGWDLNELAIQAIEDGFLVGVVQQDLYTEGVAAVDAAMDLLNDKEVQDNIEVPVDIVTKENVDEYKALFK